jgi:hypothetical protein
MGNFTDQKRMLLHLASIKNNELPSKAKDVEAIEVT